MHHIKYFALSPFMQTYTQYFTASVQQRTGFHTTFSKYLLSCNHLKKNQMVFGLYFWHFFPANSKQLLHVRFNTLKMYRIDKNTNIFSITHFSHIWRFHLDKLQHGSKSFRTQKLGQLSKLATSPSSSCGFSQQIPEVRSRSQHHGVRKPSYCYLCSFSATVCGAAPLGSLLQEEAAPTLLWLNFGRISHLVSSVS